MHIEHLAHDLFLLMLNLSQLKSQERILTLFLEAMNSVSGDVSLRWLEGEERVQIPTIKIATLKNSFGHIVLQGDLAAMQDGLLALIRNATGMLAIILENRVQETLLADENLRLETLVRERTSELVQVNKGLKKEISERKQAEKALRESEKRFRQLSELSFEAVSIHDKGVLFEANGQYFDMFGYSKDELLGKNVIPLTVAPESKEFLEEQVRSGSLEPYEALGLRKDGTRFPIEIRAREIEYHGRKVRVGIIRDITARKRAEKRLKEYSEQLEEMVQERTQALHDAQEQLMRRERLTVLGQLAGGVAHELRNPLGAIKNSAYFLNMVLEEPTPEIKQALQILDKEVNTSEKIISSLLDIARAKPPLRREVDLNGVVQEALSHISVPENVEVLTQLNPALPTILADPGQLAQVFDNLILNAVQAMTLPNPMGTPQGGRLVVKSYALDPEWAAVSFSDDGMGILPENMDKLFEPLFTTKAKGIGLGLAISKMLVKGHEGRIEAESNVEQGSTFTVSLPIRGTSLKSSFNKSDSPALAGGVTPSQSPRGRESRYYKD